MKINPAPISTPATDKMFSDPWSRWLSDISKNAVESTKISTNSSVGLKYCIQGSIVFISYVGTNTKINLPFPVYSDTVLDLYIKNDYPVIESFKVYLKSGDKTLDLSEYSGYVGDICLNGWYFINQSRPDLYQ